MDNLPGLGQQLPKRVTPVKLMKMIAPANHFIGPARRGIKCVIGALVKVPPRTVTVTLELGIMVTGPDTDQHC